MEDYDASIFRDEDIKPDTKPVVDSKHVISYKIDLFISTVARAWNLEPQ
jgi:hypothetical protein